MRRKKRKEKRMAENDKMCYVNIRETDWQKQSVSLFYKRMNVYDEFEIVGVRPQQFSSPRSADSADERVVDRCGTKWMADRWNLAGYEYRPHFSQNGPMGSAEGNPTAAGQCLAGGRCMENKSRILHGAARSGISTGSRSCLDLHTVRCELCAICKRTVTGIISTSSIQGAWTAVENKMKNKSSWFELNF